MNISILCNYLAILRSVKKKVNFQIKQKLDSCFFFLHRCESFVCMPVQTNRGVISPGSGATFVTSEN